MGLFSVVTERLASSFTSVNTVGISKIWNQEVRAQWILTNQINPAICYWSFLHFGYCTVSYISIIILPPSLPICRVRAKGVSHKNIHDCNITLIKLITKNTLIKLITKTILLAFHLCFCQRPAFYIRITKYRGTFDHFFLHILKRRNMRECTFIQWPIYIDVVFCLTPRTEVREHWLDIAFKTFWCCLSRFGWIPDVLW